MAFPVGWLRQVKVTIQNGKVPSSQTDFVSLVTQVNLPQGDNEIFDADGSHPAINGGGDLRASLDAAGSTQLPLHVVSFITDNTPANGTCELHVEIPSVSGTVDTDFYIWWEKAAETQPAVTDTFGRNAVWVTAEVAVVMEDSTPVDVTGNHTLGLTGTLTNIAGPFGRANSFAGTDELTNTDASLVDILTTYDTTISVISKKTSYLESNAVGSWSGTDDWVLYPFDTISGDGVRVFWRDLGGSQINNNAESFAGTWLWTDYTTRASNDHEVYSNAVSAGTAANTGTAGPFTTFIIGDFVSQSFEGDIAQVIVWKVAKTSDYLTTQFNNQNDPATFIIEGTPQVPAAGGVTSPWYQYAQQ